MFNDMCCPFFEREIRKRESGTRKFVGIECEGGSIRFPSAAARREFVYPYCGSVDGYVKCPIYKFLANECERIEKDTGIL